MQLTSISILVTTAFLSSGSHAATYSVSDTFIGNSFFDAFQFQAIPDPTQGRVNYLNQSAAQAKGLVKSSSDSFILRADNTTVLDPDGPGRDSTRLQSNKQFSTHVAVINLRHMPEGCGTWPAVWEIGPDFPNGGEFDIIEGVNNQVSTVTTLHTSANCTMPTSRNQTGYATSNDCYIGTSRSAGCSVKLQDGPGSFGPPFNNQGGGWFAAERTAEFFKVWFWPRGSAAVPDDVRDGSGSVLTDKWGTPAAYFPDTQCDFPSHFKPQNMMIDLTFCGSYAGAVYNTSGCPGTCEDYVNNNPSAFTNAYFDFESIRIYE